MPLSANEGETYKKEADYKAKFTVDNKAIAYALQEADGFTTLYNLSFEFNENIDLAAKPIKLNDKAIDSATDQDNTKGNACYYRRTADCEIRQSAECV